MCGSSLVKIKNRTHSRPVQNVLFLRLTVCPSSPEIDNSRSATTFASARAPSRVVRDDRQLLVDQRPQPESPAMPAIVGLTTLSLPSNAVKIRPSVPLPDRPGPTIMKIF